MVTLYLNEGKGVVTEGKGVHEGKGVSSINSQTNCRFKDLLSIHQTDNMYFLSVDTQKLSFYDGIFANSDNL